jgi:hypothetical protein
VTRRSDFTAEEWALLQETVDQTAAVMMAAAPGGLLSEMAAGFGAVVDAADAFPADALIQDLLGRTSEDAARREPHPHQPFEQTRLALLAACRAAVDLLARKATPEELSDYRRLLLYVAEKVASAGKEGAFLGIIGGRRVSEAEAALVEAIAAALGVAR